MLTNLKEWKLYQVCSQINNGIIQEINNQKIAGKSQNIQRLNNILPNNTWINKEISKSGFKK